MWRARPSAPRLDPAVAVGDRRRLRPGPCAELREHGEMFSHYVLELADEPVVVLNPDDHVVLANRGVAKLGWEPQELVGRAWGELIADHDDGSPLHLLATDVRFLYYRSQAGAGHGPTMVVIRDRAH